MSSNTLDPAAFAVNQILTSAELEQAHLYLQQTQNGVVGATKGLSEAQWRFKPAPDRWSIAEIVEHMVVVQERVLGPIRDQLASAPAASAYSDYKQVDAIVINHFSQPLDQVPGAGIRTSGWRHYALKRARSPGKELLPAGRVSRIYTGSAPTFAGCGASQGCLKRRFPVDGWLSMDSHHSRSQRASHQADSGGDGGRGFS